MALPMNPWDHPTSNIQHPTANQWPNWKPLVVRCWMLGVGCFPSVQGFNARNFRGILSPTEAERENRGAGDGPELLKPFIEFVLGHHAQAALFFAGLAVAAGLALHEDEFDVTSGQSSRPDLPLDRLADFLRPLFQRLGVAAFEQETRFRFGAGVAEQQPSALGVEFGFRLGDELRHGVQLLERLLL